MVAAAVALAPSTEPEMTPPKKLLLSEAYTFFLLLLYLFDVVVYLVCLFVEKHTFIIKVVDL